jgi:mono/diheme cytochrome c family protein
MPERRWIAWLALLAAQAAAARGLHTGQDFALIERGRYLATAADCTACHTDPAGGQPFAGGRPIQTPFGTVLAANITPDIETGIGSWSDTQFDMAVRQGRMPNGQRLYPAMPYVYYARMSRADVSAIRAYLASVAPVHQVVVSDRLPFPFSVRAIMRIWDAWYFRPEQFTPNPARSASWNRGAYLVEGPGHCQACHTPKNVLGGDERRRAFRGYTSQGWFAPNITDDDARGLARWSPADIVAYLKGGHNRLAAASGPMGEEVADASSQMTDADLLAIATYLKDQRGTSARAMPMRPDDPRMAAGAAIYQDLCSACHKADGSGVAYLIPDLAAKGAVDAPDVTTLLRVVLLGTQSVATNAEPTGPSMPGYRWQLSDAQVAAVLTYVRNHWGHAAVAVSPQQVAKLRASLARPP